MTCPTAFGRRLPWLAAACAALLCCAAVSAQPDGVTTQPAPPLPYSQAVADRFPDPAVRYDTPGLQPGRASFTSNAELDAALQALAAAPGGPLRFSAGRSLAGDTLTALHFSHGAGRPTVLLIGQQHGDEPAGAEALLVLAQQLASGALDDVLAQVDVVLLPRANPDGAALNQRRNLQGLDINRDHLLLRTPEAQAVAQLVRTTQPVLVVDAHEHAVVGQFVEKFGAVQANDLLLQTAMTPGMPPALLQAGDAWFRQPLVQDLTAAGLRSDWYYTSSVSGTDLRLAMGGLQPDTARNLQGLRNGVGVLLESRGGGIGRLHIQRRVHSHVVALRSLLHSAALHAQDLQQLRTRLGAEVAASACNGDAVVLAAQTATQRALHMLDPVTGADKTVQVAWLASLPMRPVTVRQRPCGYWLSADAVVAVQQLQALGLAVQQLQAPTPLRIEAWHETLRIQPHAGDEATSPRLVQVGLQPAQLLAPAGSWYVSLNQPLANVAVAVLEPDAPSSWFAQRLLPALDSAARVLAPPDSTGATPVRP